MSLLQPLLGLFVFLGATAILSERRVAIVWKRVFIGVAMQFLIALLLLRVPFISDALLSLNGVVNALQDVTNRAASYMFGYLAGGPTPFTEANPEHGFIVAFQVLPLILVVSALSALLFHFGILSFIVELVGKLLRRAFGISGALGLGAGATLFFGTIEAPLVIKPYLSRLSRGELLALILCSMATIAGSVMVLYASVLESSLPGALQHLITASLISLPAALTLAHIYCPTSEGELAIHRLPRSELTWIEALLDAISDAVKMIVSIIAIIIVLFALVYLLDDLLSLAHSDLSLGAILTFALRPLMWLVGFNWADAAPAAQLMGTKIVLNEFVAYLSLAETSQFDVKQTIVIAYALCGFANVASCGIIIAGLAAIMPERRREVVNVTFRALVLGNVATLMTACVVGIVI